MTRQMVPVAELDLDSPGRRDYWVGLEHDTMWGLQPIPLSVWVGPNAEEGRGVVAFGTSPLGWWNRGTEAAPTSKLELLWPLSGPNALYHWPQSTELAWYEYISAFFVGVYVLLVIGLMWSFLCSFYFSGSTVIYFLLRRDVDYIVDDDRVLLVDGNTGRIFEDRSWSDGLQQAVEAQEGISITAEKQPIARISRQRYFRLYDEFCGMTGTARVSQRELRAVYRLPVVVVPPVNRRSEGVRLA